MPVDEGAGQQQVAGSSEDPIAKTTLAVQTGPILGGSMQEEQQQVVAGGGELEESMEQPTETPNAAHTLMDPTLVALRTALVGVQIPATVVSVSSPLSKDTRQQPYAANVLDFQLRGEGAPEESSGCRISRVELATVSGFFAGLATHQQPSETLSLPVGHAGVELLVNAVYTKQVQLDGQSVVDLLQAASYLQVQCCLDAVERYLLESVLDHRPIEVLGVARSLQLQSLQKQYDRLAARFFRQSPAILVRILHELGTDGAVKLLRRDDLCCPLECFLVQEHVVQVLTEFAFLFPDDPLFPLLECVRWTAMAPAELRAVVLYLTSRGQLCVGAATLLSRLAVELVERQVDRQLPKGQPRAAAKRTIQLLAEVDSDGSLVQAQSVQQNIAGVAKAYLSACPRADSTPTHLFVYAVGQQFGVGLQAVFLALSAGGQHHMDLGKCDQCGRYLKDTSAYTVKISEQGRVHPDNDPSLTDCSRCGCPAGSHEVVQHEHAKELGNDAFTLGDYEAAVRHYSQALQLHPSDAKLWSNRAAAYLAKGWYQQALHDADHAISLRPDWPKAWGRKAAAHQHLGQYSQALEAYRKGLQLEPGSALLRQGLAESQRAEQAQQQKQHAQQRRQQARQQREEAQDVLAGRRAGTQRNSAEAQATAPQRVTQHAATERESKPRARESCPQQQGEGPTLQQPLHGIVHVDGRALPAGGSPSPAQATITSPVLPAACDTSSLQSNLETASEEESVQHQDAAHMAASRTSLQSGKPASQRDGVVAAIGSEPSDSSAISRRRVGVSRTAASVPMGTAKLGLDSLMTLLGKDRMPSTTPGPVAARRTSSSTTTTMSTSSSSTAPDELPDKLLQAVHGLVAEHSLTSGRTADSPELSSTGASETRWQGATEQVQPAALIALLPAGLAEQWEQVQRKLQHVVEEVAGLQQLMHSFAEALGQAGQPPVAATASAGEGGFVPEVEVGGSVRLEISNPPSAGSWLSGVAPGQYGPSSSSDDTNSRPPTPDGHIASIGSSEDMELHLGSGQGRVSPRHLFGRNTDLGTTVNQRAGTSGDEYGAEEPAGVPAKSAAVGVWSSPAASAPAAGASAAPLAGSELGVDAKVSPETSLETLSDGWVPVSGAPSSQEEAAELPQGITTLGSETSLGGSADSERNSSRDRSIHGESLTGCSGNSTPGSSGTVSGGGGAAEMAEGCSPWLSRHTTSGESPLSETSAAFTASITPGIDPPGSWQPQGSPHIEGGEAVKGEIKLEACGKPGDDSCGRESSSPGTSYPSSQANSPRAGSPEPSSMFFGVSGVSREISSQSDAPPQPSMPTRSPAMGSAGEDLLREVSGNAGSSSGGSHSSGPGGREVSLGSDELGDIGESSRRSGGSSSDEGEETSSCSSDVEENASEDEGDFLRAVEEARRRLGEAQGAASASAGGIPAPPTKHNRRAPTTTTAPASTAAGTSSSSPASSRPPPAAKVGSLGLGSLQSLVDGVASKLLSRRRDPQGAVRVACKACGPSGCPQYVPYSLEQLIAEGPPVAAGAAGEGLSARLLASQRLCSRCGCDCGQHETEQEGDLREMRELRARQRAERQARQRAEQQSTGGTSAGPAAGVKTGGQEDTAAVRAKRVAAAAARSQAAEESGEMLQTTDSDMLTHARRGKCGGCSGCPSFCIHFRSCDANDPEVMFYCSACGCRAEDHEVDTTWAKEQTKKQQREDAAAQRAKQTHHAQQAGFRQQQAQLFKQEAEAYAVLGLQQGADMKSVARAYKRLALQLHPDKQQQQQGAGSKPDPDATSAAAAAEKFVRVAAAYKLLMEKLG
ncbi:hypothetical protein N2152v2_010287 [Parachlorella kessleri]